MQPQSKAAEQPGTKTISTAHGAIQCLGNRTYDFSFDGPMAALNGRYDYRSDQEAVDAFLGMVERGNPAEQPGTKIRPAKSASAEIQREVLRVCIARKAEIDRLRAEKAKLVEALREIEGHAAHGGKGIITNLANVRRVVRAILRELGESA